LERVEPEGNSDQKTRNTREVICDALVASSGGELPRPSSFWGSQRRGEWEKSKKKNNKIKKKKKRTTNGGEGNIISNILLLFKRNI